MLNTAATTPWRAGLRKRLAALPRDARDTLFLLTLIGWVVVLQAEHLPLWCTALTATVLVWRGALSWQGQPLPSRWWRLGLLALTIGATLLTHRTIFGRDAGVTLIVVLLALKTLELRARRDAFVVFFLALFTLLTHFFYSQSLLTALGILLALWGLLTALVNTHMPNGKPPLWQAARVAGGMALLGAPIMLVLFALFPRMAPLWGVPSDAMTGRTGLSGQMQVGNIASLAQDTRIALRVRFEGAPPSTSDMYFRGPVLSRFDGSTWRGPRSLFPSPLQLGHDLQVAAPAIRYEVTLEPSQQPWVMVLDATPQAPVIPGHVLTLTPTLQWVSQKPFTDLVRYNATSHTQFRHGPLTAELGLQDYLELPPGFNPRLMALAQSWRQTFGHGPDAAPALVKQALNTLRTGDYLYTLEPGPYGTHSADEFWFDRKLGFCEHIASAFVVLMRSLDIPARVVTGYQGGERNPVDGHYAVRQSDAHAWTEVWLKGQGWVRVDPTAAVAPSRTAGFERLAVTGGLVGQALGTLSPALTEHLRATWEAINNSWNHWVLNYSQGRQLDLLKNLGFDAPRWEDLGYVLAGLLAAVSLTGAGWALWERRQHDPWLRLLQQARRQALALGLDAGPDTTPRQLAQRLQAQFAQHPETPALASWLLQLETLRYAPSADASNASVSSQLAALRHTYNTLRWPTPAA